MSNPAVDEDVGGQDFSLDGEISLQNGTLGQPWGFPGPLLLGNADFVCLLMPKEP